MKKRSGATERDTLRPHYDLDKLEVVAYGPGWSEQGRRRRNGDAGRVTGTRSGEASPAKEAPAERPKKDEMLDEAVSLLLRARAKLEGDARAEKLRERIENFIDRARA